MSIQESLHQAYLPEFSENTGNGKVAESPWTEFAKKHHIEIRIRPIVRKTGFSRHRHYFPLWKKLRYAYQYGLPNPWTEHINKALQLYKTKPNR